MTAELPLGTAVRIVSDRPIADRVWRCTTGVVWGEFRKGEVDDYVLVAVDGDGTVILGFAPDELEVAA